MPKNKFEDRFAFMEWLGELLDRELGDQGEVSSEENSSTGRADIIINTNDDEEVRISIKMFDAEVNEK